MFDPTRGPARAEISPRQTIDKEGLAQLRNTGILVTDDRRVRPLYFNGRFLTARDLTREQNYFLSRQADLVRAGGAGVIYGLLVTGDGSTITIAPGHGVTPAGELVILPESFTLRVNDIAQIQHLNLILGVSEVPRETARNLSGLFVVALRPVEFTAHPVASYPTSITGNRSVEDGDWIEATAVTLIPYPDEGDASEQGVRRARVARKIFVDGDSRGTLAGVLPLAMVALERGIVQWVDSYMARREVGAEHGDVLGLGFAPRAMREAHLLQYDRHLADVLHQRKSMGRSERFHATEHFMALPPGGRLPAAAIDTTNFTQIFFPADVTVDLSIVPSDEIRSLLEDSLLLPPIDLTLSGGELESTSVLVVIPLPRSEVREIKDTLTGLMRPTLERPIRPAAPGLIAKRAPLELLRGLRLPRIPEVTVNPQVPVDEQWRNAMQRAASRNEGLLWYMRRRNLPYRAELVGATSIVIDGPPDQ